MTAPEPIPDGRAAATPPLVWSYRRAIVAFEDRTGGGLLRLLAPGFRHCFCVLGDGERWTLVDPLKARIQLLSLAGCRGQDLLHLLAADGRRLLLGRPLGLAPLRSPLWRPFTCVEVVKRMLDLDAADVFTPRQLHAALVRRFGFVEAQPGGDFIPQP
jgi:hypothetical protein